MKADFSGEVSLARLASHPFQLEKQEEQVAANCIVKILKIMLYKQALIEKT